MRFKISDYFFLVVFFIANSHAEEKQKYIPIATSYFSEVDIPSFRENSESKNCHINILNPYNASIGGSGYRHAIIKNMKSVYNDLGFSFICFDKSSDNWQKGRAIQFDDKNKVWIKNINNRLDASDDPDLANILDKVTEINNIKAKNSQGFAITEDDINGNEGIRRRMLDFCLIHINQVLCGNGRIMILSDPKSNLLPYALEIIQSIEFVN